MTHDNEAPFMQQLQLEGKNGGDYKRDLGTGTLRALASQSKPALFNRLWFSRRLA
ncbi:MAG: hypothetical protein QNL17_02210 [Synechococcus sp. ChSW.bin.154]